MNDFRCSILCNSFDVGRFRFNEEDRERIRDQYYLYSRLQSGHVGRFEDQKNHLQLVDQFAALHTLRPDASLLPVGRGSLMETVRQKCERLGIVDCVVFAGAQKNPALFLSARDIIFSLPCMKGWDLL